MNHTLLLQDLLTTNIHPNVARWLATFLRGRTSAVSYHGVLSPPRAVVLGVPQGGVLSPDLFNFYIADQPASASLHVGYADDSHDGEPAVDVSAAADRLTRAMGDLDNWVESKDLALAPDKSTVTLFTPDTHQSHHHPQVLLRGQPLRLERNPTILGVSFDPHFTFSHHARTLATKARAKLALLKATAGSTWGATKEMLQITFKGLVKSTLNYAAPIWAPNMSPSSFSRLQRVQNAALRVITGCHAASSLAHLHTEAMELPVEPHAHLLGAQFLAAALTPGHSSHPIATSDPGPRSMKFTLASRYMPTVSPYLTNGILPTDDLKPTLTKIHSEAVLNSIAALGHNPLIGCQAPPYRSLGEIPSAGPTLYSCAAPLGFLPPSSRLPTPPWPRT